MSIAITGSLHSLYFDPIYVRDQWREALSHINRSAQPGDLALVRPHHYVPLYYYDLREIPWYTVPYLGSRQEYEAFLDAEVPGRLGEGARVWTIVVCENANPHRFVHGRPEDLRKKVQSDEMREWLMVNYELLSEETYVGVYLASYGTPPGHALSRRDHRSFVLLTDSHRYPYTGT